MFSVVAPATATGGAGALFMLPFWIAGGAVAKQSLLDPARATSLSIGEFAWELSQTLPGESYSRKRAVDGGAGGRRGLCGPLDERRADVCAPLGPRSAT